MTRERYSEVLQRIELELLALGELAGAAVQKAVRALTERDAQTAQEVVEGDEEIDRTYVRIEQEVLGVTALQAPVAADLRLISAILHSCLHLERIGDQAVNIAKLHLATKELPASQALLQQLAEMGDISVQMVRTAMEGFARRDVELCRSLPAMDDPLDRLNRRAHLEALKLADDPKALDWGMHMVIVARALERVGDNAVDIGEQVGFVVTGEFGEPEGSSQPVEAG